MSIQPWGPVISLMLAVADAPAAVAWYRNALGAAELWNLGSVAGLSIGGAPFFVGQPEANGWESPEKLGTTSARVEVFCDDPDAFVAQAVAAGAKGDSDPVRNHQALWGIHRQGGFVDPFGHVWLVGDRSPLEKHGSTSDRNRLDQAYATPEDSELQAGAEAGLDSLRNLTKDDSW